MNTKIILALGLAWLAGLQNLGAQGTSFSYSGRLSDNGGPANGSYSLRFALFDAASAGNRTGSMLTNASVLVSNGLFSVALDFGPGVFPGAPRWLEIGVRTNGATIDFTTLIPRQSLLATPYAITAGTVTGPVA